MNNSKHIYIRKGPSCINVLTHTFVPGATAPDSERVQIPVFGPTPEVGPPPKPGETIATWLTTQLADLEVKVIYNCAGSGVKKPEGIFCAWFDLPPGHPCQNL